MAILAVNRKWSGESWEDDVEGPRGYVEFYQVISNDPQESEVTVRLALPLPGQVHYLDSAAHVKSRACVRSAESRLIWEATINYAFDPTDPDEPVEDPLNEPVKFRWPSSLYTKPAIKDRNGKAIVNSAGDFFDPPPEVEEPLWQVNAQANVASVPAAVLSWAGRVNSGSFTVDGISVDAEKARIMAIDIGEKQMKNDISFRVFTYTLEFREEGWDLEILDQGYRIKDGTELKDILIEDEDGNESRPSAPVLLDGAGAKLADPDPDSAVFLDFGVAKLLDFTTLPGIS